MLMQSVCVQPVHWKPVHKNAYVLWELVPWQMSGGKLCCFRMHSRTMGKAYLPLWNEQKRTMGELLITASHVRPQRSIKLAKQSIATTTTRLPQKTHITNHIYWFGGIVCRKFTLLAVTRNIYDLRCLIKCANPSNLDQFSWGKKSWRTIGFSGFLRLPRTLKRNDA